VDGRLDPRVRLAGRLRGLRIGTELTQLELARALAGNVGRLSAASVSAWESVSARKIPPAARLEAYATFFATPRSIEGEPRLLSLQEMTQEELHAREVLLRELMWLRDSALSTAVEPGDLVDGRPDPRVTLARRLRELREEHWPGTWVPAPALARALGPLSAASVSAWESVSARKIPPAARLEAYATFFATPRSIEGEPRLLSLQEMTQEELHAREVLLGELMRLRENAQRIQEFSDRTEVPESWNIPGPEKPVGHVFISYVREDSHHVDRLQNILEAAGIPVWRDTASIWPGQDWREKIRSAITDNALVFIACFSRISFGRDKSYQNEELTLAIEQLRLRQPENPWLIPIRFDECEIPDREIGGGRRLGSIQRADLFGDRFDEGAARLLATIQRIFGADPER
jgi:transcriptional regulator with XRE-family HTH domain